MFRPSYGPRKTLYNRFVRWSAKGVWREVVRDSGRGGRPSSRNPARQHAREGASLCRGWKGGLQAQAIGISRGGRTTKIHALTDRSGRPLRFLLTVGQAADCRAAEALLLASPADALVHGRPRLRHQTPSATRSRSQAPSRTSRPSATVAGSPASAACSIATATPSSACSAASRTTAASRPATTSSQPISSAPSTSQQPSHSGCKSEP